MPTSSSLATRTCCPMPRPQRLPPAPAPAPAPEPSAPSSHPAAAGRRPADSALRKADPPSRPASLKVPEPVARIVIRGTLPQGRSGVGDAKVRRNGDHGDHHDRDVRHDLFFYVAACVQDLCCFHVLPVYHLCKIDSCFFPGFIPHRVDADKELAHHGHQQIASLR